MTETTPRILGPNGKPVSTAGQLYKSPRSNPKAYKTRATLSRNTRQNVSEYDRAELVDYSRQLVSQVDILATAIEQKNNWAFGDSWSPHYVGRDRYDWVEEAKEFLEQQFYPFCNLRGPQFDMRESLKLMGKAWDRDGDDVMILTESESGFPQVAFFPSTRIGSGVRRRGGTSSRNIEQVIGGQFDGAFIFDGVILNRDHRPIGVRILDEDGLNHTDVSMFNADLAFEPQWVDQMRGYPKIAVPMLGWMNIQEITEFLQASVKRASAFSFKVKNAEGEAGTGNEVITEEDSPAAAASDNVVDGSDERKLHYEEMPGGGIFAYLDSTHGEDIEQLKFESPHPNVEDFIKRLTHDAISAVGWHYELVHLGETGRAPTRLVAELANQTIWDRQATARRRWKRMVGYALAKAAKNGYIRKPRDPRDYGLWEPGYPKQISVDAGNDVKASIELCKFGLSTASIEIAKSGYHIDYIQEEQERHLRSCIAMADRLHPLVASKGVQYMDVLQMIRQNNPNPVSQQPQQQEAPNAD